MSTPERIAWGLLSFIALIILLRWLGTPEDQKKVPPRVRKGEERREAENDDRSRVWQ